MSQPSKTNSKPKVAMRADGMVEKYGLLVPVTAPAISVELMCYRDAGTEREVKGNLGAEEHFRRAFRMMWPEYEWSEWVDLLIWAWCNYKWIVVIGHQRASKSYTMAHVAWLDYCADPENTLTSLGTVTLQGLRIRMWSDMQRAAETAKVQFPFKMVSSTNELRVFPTESQREAAEKFQIMGMALNQSRDAEGKIRGGHAPRRRIFLDEAENIAAPIYDAAVNPMSAPDAKFAALTNPMLKLSKLGKMAEPLNGWSSVSDSDLVWPLKRYPNNGICVHLDGRQSPNVKARGRKFTGLLVQEDIDEIMRIHGANSLQYWSLVVGFPAPDGVVDNIFPASVLEKGTKAIEFNFRPRKCASLDPAFEFDASILTVGSMGMLQDRKMAINATETIKIVYEVGENVEPKDYQCAHQVMAHCQRLGIEPKDFIMDKSGGGRGVFAILQVEWSRDIQGIEYGGAATDRPMGDGKNLKASETVEKFVTELWVRARYYMQFGMLGGLANLAEETVEDLAGRIYTLKDVTHGKVMVAEKKVDYKVRLGRSCDWGDSFCGLGELLIRQGFTAGGSTGSTVTNKWGKARVIAKQAAAIYQEETEFSY